MSREGIPSEINNGVAIPETKGKRMPRTTLRDTRPDPETSFASLNDEDIEVDEGQIMEAIDVALEKDKKMEQVFEAAQKWIHLQITILSKISNVLNVSNNEILNLRQQEQAAFDEYLSYRRELEPLIVIDEDHVIQKQLEQKMAQQLNRPLPEDYKIEDLNNIKDDFKRETAQSYNYLVDESFHLINAVTDCEIEVVLVGNLITKNAAFDSFVLYRNIMEEMQAAKQAEQSYERAKKMDYEEVRQNTRDENDAIQEDRETAIEAATSFEDLYVRIQNLFEANPDVNYIDLNAQISRVRQNTMAVAKNFNMTSALNNLNVFFIRDIPTSPIVNLRKVVLRLAENELKAYFDKQFASKLNFDATAELFKASSLEELIQQLNYLENIDPNYNDQHQLQLLIHGVQTEFFKAMDNDKLTFGEAIRLIKREFKNSQLKTIDGLYELAEKLVISDYRKINREKVKLQADQDMAEKALRLAAEKERVTTKDKIKYISALSANTLPELYKNLKNMQIDAQIKEKDSDRTFSPREIIDDIKKFVAHTKFEINKMTTNRAEKYIEANIQSSIPNIIGLRWTVTRDLLIEKIKNDNAIIVVEVGKLGVNEEQMQTMIELPKKTGVRKFLSSLLRRDLGEKARAQTYFDLRSEYFENYKRLEKLNKQKYVN